MIQLYDLNNTDYTKNGNTVLLPTSAELKAELNGAWTVNLKHPIDKEGRWNSITEGTVVKAPSFMANEQLYRVISVEKADSGITAVCEPIFMDAMNEVFLTDVRPTKKNGQQALDILFNGTKYSGTSDINKVATSYYEYMNAIEAINGDNDNAFTKRWGGEILFDNYNIIINERVGGDYGVQLLYGKNIPVDGLTEQVDMSTVVTRVYPKGYNGVTYSSGGVAYVDSPLISSYPIVYSRTIDYSNIKMAVDASEEDKNNPEIVICNNQTQLNAALAAAVNNDFTAGLDKPSVTISADMVMLADTTLYHNFSILEQVGLGDTIHCKHSKLGIVTDARVVELTYDSILKKVTAVTLGDFEYNYFSNVSSAVSTLSQLVDEAIRSDGSLIAEKVKGFINGAYASLTAQYNVAQKQDVQAILFENLDTSSPMYGALGIGTQGLQVSKTRTADGRAWDWSTAITAEGIIADMIVTGILASRVDPANNYWNLDTGDLSLSGTFYIKNGSVQITTADDTTNYITLNGTSVLGHQMQSEQSAGELSVSNKTLNGKTYIQGHMLAIDFPSSLLYMTVDPDTGKNPRIGYDDKEKGVLYWVNSDGVYWKKGNNEMQFDGLNNEIFIKGTNGTAAMQPGRFVCADANGNIKFDSNNYTS